MAERGRPATGETPQHKFRCSQTLWDEAKSKAALEGRTMTDVLTDYLRRYVAAPPRTRTDSPPPE